MNIPFTKMHGFGNDFMVLDQTANKIDLSAEKIRQLSNRHTGIGFDQVLQIEQASSSEVDFDYRIFNADGVEVEHCGNGARCFAKYVHDKGLSSKNPLRVKTVNRVLILHANKNGEVTVNMGMPEFKHAAIPFLAKTNGESDTEKTGYLHSRNLEIQNRLDM